MCDTLQLNWKLPNPLKPLSTMNNNRTKLIGNSTKVNNGNNIRTINNTGNNPATSSGGRQKKANAKYGLRACSIQKRIEVEGRKGQPRKRGPKPRPKPQPMSKYRRKTANLRERMRMGEINTAFEVLREKIPTPLATTKSARCEKLTKINILHVAINYIRALESILDTGDAGVQVYGTSVVRSPLASGDYPEADYAQEIKPSQTANRGGKKLGGVGGGLKKPRMKKPSSSSSLSSTVSMSNLSHSSGDDSGIADEEDIDHDDDEEEDDVDYEYDDVVEKMECPDWTELTSTLEFGNHATPLVPTTSAQPLTYIEMRRPLQPQQQHQLLMMKPRPPTSMETLLTTAAHQINNVGCVMNNNNNPVTFQESNLDPTCRRPMFKSMMIQRQVSNASSISFSDHLDPTTTTDLLADLNVLEDSLEDGFSDINFVHDDPFQIFV